MALSAQPVGGDVTDIEKPTEQIETVMASSTEEIVEEVIVEPEPDPVTTPVVTQNQDWINLEGKKRLEERFGIGHPLIEVARCESGYRQFNDDGTLLVNPSPNSSATGVFQILSITHGPAAAKIGADIETFDGNADFAEHLYETQGLQPWEESRHCWGKSV